MSAAYQVELALFIGSFLATGVPQRTWGFPPTILGQTGQPEMTQTTLVVIEDLQGHIQWVLVGTSRAAPGMFGD